MPELPLPCIGRQFQAEDQYVMPVFVAWNTLQWMPVGVGSFREHFPSWQILVIDNNPVRGGDDWNLSHDEERTWLESQDGLIVIPNSGPKKSHGEAIDLAVDWCRRKRIEYLLHLEPDCLVTGRTWYRRLCQAIDAGAWMAGSHRKQYGPIHPTPSLWRLSELKTGFDICARGNDEQHPRFPELFDKPWLMRAITEAGLDVEFWECNWDTGQQAWFECALVNKAAHVVPTSDFTHFWHASTRSPRQISNECEDIAGYLNGQFPNAESRPGPVSKAADTIRHQLVAVLRNTKARRAVYAGCPRHANTGDLLLLHGTMSAIESAGIEITKRLPWPEIPKTDCDAIFLHGGGNFGDVYRHEQEFRLQVCRECSDKKIIWLPQSVNYRSLESARNDVRMLKSCKHVEVWLRDAVSFARAEELEIPRIKLVPDGVFGLQHAPGRYHSAGVKRVVRRGDLESTQNISDDSDWMLPGQTMLHDISEAWDMAVRVLDGVRVVVTDRLHVHLACVISDIPNILVADRYGKNRAMYLTWTHAHERSQFAEHWNHVQHIESEIFQNLSTESRS